MKFSLTDLFWMIIATAFLIFILGSLIHYCIGEYDYWKYKKGK